ncbi:hypothetical protein DER46DRAFT_601801 [Fusarium sp. MPI-SDFR-AT-0072]|nr:hypothetical protein DER46DRAFT_601801 [Fusarium sp. MPI-SDFR-AT-0072]
MTSWVAWTRMEGSHRGMCRRNMNLERRGTQKRNAMGRGRAAKAAKVPKEGKGRGMLNLGFPHLLLMLMLMLLLLLMLMSRLGGPVRVVTPPASCLFMVLPSVVLPRTQRDRPSRLRQAGDTD